MQKLVRDYLNELKRKQKKRKRVGTAVVLLVILVIGTVIGGLTQAGVAMTGNAKCGIEEHEHSDGCYEDVLACGQEEGEGHQHGEGCYTTETRLSCGMDEAEGHQHDESCYDEAGNLICGTEEAAGHQHDDSCYTTEEVLTCEQEEGEGHIHSDACYEKELACKKEEHTHTEECYIDKKADVEDSSKWDEQYKDTEWKETWAENLVIAAEAQIGYKESEDNYEVAEDGSHKGYTRYGQFMDNVYADWDAAFVNFCMHYAGKDDINIEASEVFPKETEAVKWYEEFIGADEKNMSYLVAPQGYEPKAGDLIFFDRKDEEPVFQMGIVSSYDEEKNEIKVIEGNSDNEVKENEYGIRDEDIEENHIFGYLKMDEVEEAYKASKKTAEDDADQKEDENTEQPQEEIKELTTEVDGTTITLSGPVSSFEEGKEYSIQAEKVENKETIATIEEAIDQVAEEKEKKVENYQAFDIKLMVDGEEVQPLGPVEVKFSSREVARSVEDEATEVNVIHVDENTGEATDMEATPTEEKEVVIETEHFSVYVYIELGNQEIGGIKINIQHWGEKIQTVNREYESMNKNTPEEGFDVKTGKVKMTGEKEGGGYDEEERKCQLYATDTDYSLPNETYVNIKSLSKVYNVSDTGYKISKVWVSKGGKEESDKYDETAKGWTGEYDEYTYQQLEQDEIIDLDRLPDGCTIRFWYEPKDGTRKDGVSFYDYTVGYNEKVQDGDRKGINKDVNYREGANNTSPRLGVGQPSFGNTSSWGEDQYGDKNYYLNQGNGDNQDPPRAYAFEGLVKPELIDGELAFVDGIDAPQNLFKNEPDNGSRLYEDYELGFIRNGDTYTLSDVYKKGSQTPISSATGLQEFSYSKPKWGDKGTIWSNEFWPLDDVTEQTDPIDPKNEGDFGKHNWYFGMAFNVTFDVTDYTGPLEYYFRGDDDFWLFVDGKLAVDLGGIHAALGKAFDLKSFMENQGISMEGEHTLTVYYMERGATGSCCYMQFTLPRVQINPLPQQDVTSCTVRKEWNDDDNRFRPGSIKATLYKEKKGEAEVPVRTVTLPYEGKWEFTWENLPVYDGKNRKEITYSVKEVLEADNPMWDYETEVKKEESSGEILATISNKLKLHKIKVEKLWQGDDNEKVNRPDKIEFQLYYKDFVNNSGKLVPYLDRDNKPRIVKLTEDSDGKWKGEFVQVPKYYYNPGEGKWLEVEYWIKEVSNSVMEGEYNGKNGAIYQIGNVVRNSLTDEEKEALYIDSFQVSNTLITKNVCIEKVSKSSGVALPGAVFNLYGEDAFDSNGKLNSDAKPIRPSITTGDDGLVDIQGLRFGTYYLMEIQAPSNFAVLEKPIKIVASAEGVTVDFQIEGWEADSEHFKVEDGKYIITIPNEIIYELPSTGGSGIYWYMLGGVLLMAVTSLITYRNKRREVLRS